MIPGMTLTGMVAGTGHGVVRGTFHGIHRGTRPGIIHPGIHRGIMDIMAITDITMVIITDIMEDIMVVADTTTIILMDVVLPEDIAILHPDPGIHPAARQAGQAVNMLHHVLLQIEVLHPV